MKEKLCRVLEESTVGRVEWTDDLRAAIRAIPFEDQKEWERLASRQLAPYWAPADVTQAR
jgi:hypothetical protein